MVIINQKAFNDDMDQYISKLRKKSPLALINKIPFLKTTNEEVPEMLEGEIHIEYKEPSFIKKVLSWRRKLKLGSLKDDLSDKEKDQLEEIEGEIEAIEQEEEQLEEMEEELEEKRESLLSLLFRKINIFKKTRREEEYLEEDFEEQTIQLDFDEDVKEVLKIVHTWIEKLSPKKKKEFKDSKDFEKYKDILLKYGLVKEK